MKIVLKKNIYKKITCKICVPWCCSNNSNANPAEVRLVWAPATNKYRSSFSHCKSTWHTNTNGINMRTRIGSIHYLELFRWEPPLKRESRLDFSKRRPTHDISQQQRTYTKQHNNNNNSVYQKGLAPSHVARDLSHLYVGTARQDNGSVKTWVRTAARL